MTTRRRRAGSSECEETQDPAAALQTPVNSQVPQLTPNFGWSAPNKLTTPQEAYYKKTDSRPNTQPSIYNPAQYSASQSAYPPNTFNNFTQSITNYFQPQQQQQQTPAQFDPCTQIIPGEEFEISDMACRDRSREFTGIIRSQQQGHLSNGNAGPKGAIKSSRDISQYSNFMKRSRFVGVNISKTYAKLEKLTLIARKRSLFDDSQDAEVQELTAIIRHDLTSLTQQLEELRKSTAVPSPSSTSHMQKHSANLLGSLQTKVANITSKFRDVLEVRTENLKKQAERREQFTGGIGIRGSVSSPALGSVGMNGGLPPLTKSVMEADEAKATAMARRDNKTGDVVVNFDGLAGGSSGGGAYQQQLQLMEEQDSLLTARAETMKTIESTIVELGTMFSQLATMVKEQDELVYRIDANVDDAEMNVEAAHTELLKYFRSISSNRWLMMKVFGIVIVFFIIFIVFMA